MNANIEKKDRTITGEVVSVKMKDTVVVRVSRYKKTPKYGKFITRSQRFKAHDKGNTCVLGQIVSIKETKPISKDKRFIVVSKEAVKERVEEIVTE